MNIIQYPQRVSPSGFRRPVSTARVEGKLAEARRYQQQASNISAITGLATDILGIVQHVTEKAKQAREVDQYSNAIMGATEQLNDLKLKYAQDMDYTTQLDRFLEDAEEVNIGIIEGITEPEAQKQYKNWWRKTLENYRIDIAYQAKNLEGAHNFYNLKSNLGKIPSMVGTVEEKQKMTNVLLSGGLAAGTVDQARAQQMKDEVYHAIDVEEVSKRTLQTLMENGIDEARKYLYSTDLSSSEIEKIEKGIKEYEKQVIDIEVGKMAELFYTDDGTIGVTHEMINASRLPEKGDYGKIWWHKELDKELDKKLKEKKDAQAKAEYDSLMDEWINKANNVNIKNENTVNRFIASIQKSGLKEDDEGDIKNIVMDRKRTYETEKKRIEEDEKTRLEGLRNKDYVTVYEGIRTKAINNKEEYRDKTKYPYLDEKEDWPKLDKQLEDRDKPETRYSNPDTLAWLASNWDNSKIDNKEFMKYVMDNRENLAGEKYGDFKTWLNRARERDTTKADPARKDAINLIDETFKKFIKDTKDVDEQAALRREQSLVEQDYIKWLEDNTDETYENKIKQAENMVTDFRKSSISKLLDKASLGMFGDIKASDVIEQLTERREIRAGTLGLDEFLKYTGRKSISPQNVGTDRDGYVTFKDGDEYYRYNSDKERLEYLIKETREWVKAKKKK